MPVDQHISTDIYQNECVLVFHGIDTIATIRLNDHELIPAPHNMFVRYRYDVSQLLQKVRVRRYFT